MMFQMDEQKRNVAEFYSRVAPFYDHVGPAVFTRFGQRMTALANIFAGAHVLDIAVGRGANLFAAAEYVDEIGEVVGIDIAEGMVDETHEAILRHGLTNASVLQMDAEHLNFADNSFDYALCNFAIFWFPNKERVLTEALRVLRPGGVFGVTLPEAGDERWQWYYVLLKEYFERFKIELEPLGGERSRDFERFQELMERVGFTQVRSQLIEEEFVYENETEWWNAKWMHGERYPLENMPSPILDQFKADVIAGMAGLREPDGFHERWRVTCMFGEKPAVG